MIMEFIWNEQFYLCMDDYYKLKKIFMKGEPIYIEIGGNIEKMLFSRIFNVRKYRWKNIDGVIIGGMRLLYYD